MTLVSELQQSEGKRVSRKPRWWWVRPSLTYGFFGWLFLTQMVQCGAVNRLSFSYQTIADRPMVLQANKGQQVISYEPLAEEENQRRFVAELLPMLLSAQSSIPDKFCTDGCSKADKTIKVEGVGTIPTITHIASYGLNVSYQQPFLKAYSRNLKQSLPGFNNGASREYQVVNVGEPKPTNTPGEFQAYVVGTSYYFAPNGSPSRPAHPDDRIVTIREILPPSHTAKQTALQKVITGVRQRGYEVVSIEGVN